MKSVLLFVFSSLVVTICFSQNGIVGTGFSTGWSTTDTINFSKGPGASRIFIGTPGTSDPNWQNPTSLTDTEYFRLMVDGEATQISPTGKNGTDLLVNPGIEFNSLNNQIDTVKDISINSYGGEWFLIDTPSQKNKYIFKTLDKFTSSTSEFIVFKILGGNVQTLSTVTPPPTTTYVNSALPDFSVTATFSGSLPTGQVPYLRYTTSNYFASSVVAMTGSGTTYTASIPTNGMPVGNIVSYYVFTSGASNVATDGFNADFYSFDNDMTAAQTFKVINGTPSITSFFPPSNCPDSSTTLYIFGTNLTGATAVTMGGKAVDSFNVNSDASITAFIAKNSIGSIKVITPEGSAASSDSFTNNNGYKAYAYVANYTSKTVSVVNVTSNSIITTVAVGVNPADISINPDGTKAYVVNQGNNSVSVINTATNKVIDNIIVGNSPLNISISPDGTKAYVTNLNDNSMSVINTLTNLATTAIHVGNQPMGITVSPDGTKVYVANFGDNTISVINTATNNVIATISVGSNPEVIKLSPDGTKAYVTNENSNSVSVINTLTNLVATTLPVGGNPRGLYIAPDGTKVYVTNFNDNTVSVINTTTYSTTTTINVGNSPNGVCGYPDGTKAYILNGGDNTVSILNILTNKVDTTLTGFITPLSFGNFIGTVPITCGVPTPVTITTIEAVNKNGSIVTNWRTSTELNTDHFIVQHSTDCSSFTDIGTVKAVGSGANSYSFTDCPPAPQKATVYTHLLS